MKKYIFDREMLKELLLAYKSFLTEKAWELIRQGGDTRTITFSQSEKWTHEFIDQMIHELPVDTLMDQLDEALEDLCRTNSKKHMDKAKKHYEQSR